MRWFARRHFAPSEINVIEHDGIRYDARAMFRPPSGQGQWQRFADRVRRSYALFAGRGQVEARTINSVPWSQGDSLTPTSAGQSQALRLGAVWSAIRLICDTVSTLPVKSYRKAGETRTPAPLPALFRQLDDDGTLVPWLWRCVSSLMLRGNAYGLITSRDGMQFPTVIQWLDPDEVSCNDTNPWAPIWYWRGQVVPTEDFVHIPWFVIAGKVQGLSPIEAYALSVSTGLQAQEYGATWFSNGGVPPGTMKNTRQTIDRPQAEAISDRLVSAIKRRRPIVYGADWEFQPITVPPDQAQFLETVQASASQIAAIYGIPPEYVGGNSGDPLTYSTVEQNAIRLNQALRPLLVRLDNAFSALMPNKQRVKLNADATARADLKTRLEAYEIGLRTGLYTLDEVRTLEDMPPLPPGAPRPMLQPAPQQARKFNAGQPRDPGGENGGQWTAGAGGKAKDALKLAGKIDLAPDETLVASAKVDSDMGGIRMALTEQGGQRKLRFGAGGEAYGQRIPDEGIKAWDGNPAPAPLSKADRDRLTAEAEALDEEHDSARLDAIRDLLRADDEGFNGTAKLDEYGMQRLAAKIGPALAEAVEQEKVENAAYDELEALQAKGNADPDWIAELKQIARLERGNPGYEGLVFDKGIVPGSEWGDVHYSVELDDLETGVFVTLGVTPKGAPDDWVDARDWRGQFDAAASRKFLRLLGQYAG